LPAGVLGFRASGKITRDEYVGMMERGEKPSIS
jgi:hypothetical protein